MNQRNQVLDAASEIDDLLKRKLKAKGPDLTARLSHVRRKLPSKIRRQASLVATAANQLKSGHQPGVSNPQKILAAHQSVVAHLDGIDLKAQKQERRVARRKWVSDLMINYAIFLALLIGFYVIATGA